MSQEFEQQQELAIQVVNLSGAPVAGVLISVSRDGVELGQVISSGRSTITADRVDGLELTVFHGANATSARVPPGQQEIRLVVRSERFIELASVPTAVCPDGTTGQPCVTCQIDGRTYRICG